MKKANRQTYPTIVPQPGSQPMIATPYEKNPLAGKRRLSPATIERHMQIIAKWEREGIVTKLKARQLRQEALAQL